MLACSKLLRGGAAWTLNLDALARFPQKSPTLVSQPCYPSWNYNGFMSRTEEFHVNGEDLVRKFKEIIASGMARRIIIRDEQDKTLVEIPLAVAAVGTVLAPVLAAVGALAALVTKCKIVVERVD